MGKRTQTTEIELEEIPGMAGSKKYHTASSMDLKVNRFITNQHDHFTAQDAAFSRAKKKSRAEVRTAWAKQLKSDGMTIAQIAKKMKCSESTVKRYLR